MITHFQFAVKPRAVIACRCPRAAIAAVHGVVSVGGAITPVPTSMYSLPDRSHPDRTWDAICFGVIGATAPGSPRGDRSQLLCQDLADLRQLLGAKC